ncbi:tetratricopeptide repeat protein [Catellatospora vulcania]|uniref:hypothetical protein n=1 Tax=Catellatospora vulcania TaxID=1460450 RepID=UPI0012D447DF|nr:hypothetical protein [Catellatospora vulcania]
MWPFRKKVRAAPEESPPEITIDPFLGDADARRLSMHLGNRDWAAARAIVMNPDPVLHGYYAGIASTKSGLMEWIDDAVRSDPDPTVPLLVKGLAAISWAWDARGSGYASSVTEEGWKLFRQRLVLAENCLDEVLDRDPGNVKALAGLITLASARSKGLAEIQRRFDAVIAIDPTNESAHATMLQAVCRKWSGSSELMFRFARERAAAFPGTGLPGLIAEAHIEEWLSRKKEDEYLEQREVGDELVAAAESSIWHPDYRRTPNTPYVWNAFAMAFALGDHFTEAERCFALIGDAFVTDDPWYYHGKAERSFVKLRDYTRYHLAEA